MMKLISKALIMSRVKGIAQFYVYPQRNEPSCLSYLPQSITALWPVLISRPVEDRRLSWPGCMADYIPRWYMPPEDGHPSQYQPTDSASAGIELCHDH